MDIFMLMNSTLLALAGFGLVSLQPAQIAQAKDTLASVPALAGDLDPAVPELPSEDLPSEDLPSEDALAEDGSAVSPTANYSDDRMSIDYPVSWQIAVSPDDNVQILDGTKGSPDEVVTEIFVVDSPPGVLINANIDSFITEGSAVGPYGQVTIDDQEAFTIWLADRPVALSRAIATFIGYDDQTVLLFSSFTPENEAVEEHLLELHNSFKKVADAELEPESTPEDDSELEGVL
ncbi:hypothetical protein [cf. Phormidesmis sp. LEGE 11477]|uniref:hypothetical protein n=1 Tax=cf. Phormidesmis sp. LEGE 11477 TaxID=1828680 RepID=UPI001881DAEE|nr:hypothetical protein [cf. Phormidesmis sp. LEGE 11477]MBE9061294.1 hypothetical protein [cf. Phormidesmis sp. LEGE 11477]